MKLILAILVLSLTVMVIAKQGDKKSYLKDYNFSGVLADQDHGLSFGTICRNKGYPFEQHKVRTYDGFFLTIFRIPGRKNDTLEGAIAAKRPAILLWHGLLGSADNWIINDEDKAPAFALANAGYDVWLGNSRGNKHSREHRFLDPDRAQDEASFFGFSFEDMATHDSNATVAYIRQQTGKASIGVIGHSLGATQFLLTPQTGIAILVNLAGSSILNHTEDKLVIMAAENPQYLETLKSYGISELFPANIAQSSFSRICETFSSFCESLVDNVLEQDTDYLNMDRYDELLGHFPAGTSLKNIEHFVQIYKSKRFQKYDYGLELNRKIYLSDNPPLFDLTKASTFKIIHIVGEEDKTATPIDSNWMREQLGTRVIYYGSYRMGHLGFMLGKDLSYLNKVIELLKANSWA